MSMEKYLNNQPIALVTATRKEMQAVLGGRVQGLALKVNNPEKFMWGSRPLTLLITGIGPVNAALALGHLLGGKPGLAGVLNVGIAGGFQPEKIPLGGVVRVQTEIWPEFGLHTAEGLDPQGLGLGHGRVQGRVIWDRLDLHPLKQAYQMGLELCSSWPLVKSVSVAGVSGSPDRAAELQAKTRAEVENMEGFALAWACTLQDVPFVQIRTISNRVGSRSNKEWNMGLALCSLRQATKRLLGPDQDPLPGEKQ